VALAMAAALGLLPAAAGGQTATYRYFPFTAEGKVKGSLKVNRQQGRCFFGSFSNPRIDTYRCVGKKFLLDPCFKKPRSRRVLVCVGSPWRRTAVLLTVKRKLKSHGAGKPNPWALVVEGLRCTWASGATTGTQYGRLNYSCPGRLFLFGYPLGAPSAFIWGGTDPNGADATQSAVNEIWR